MLLCLHMQTQLRSRTSRSTCCSHVLAKSYFEQLPEGCLVACFFRLVEAATMTQEGRTRTHALLQIWTKRDLLPAKACTLGFVGFVCLIVYQCCRPHVPGHMSSWLIALPLYGTTAEGWKFIFVARKEMK